MIINGSHNLSINFQYQFTFQHVFDEYASQKALFDYIALPLVEDLVAGKNGEDIFFLQLWNELLLLLIN